MKGMRAPKASVHAPKALKKKSKKIDQVTGIKYLDRGWYREAVRPEMPRSCPTTTDSVEELVQKCHYILVKDWNLPRGATASEIASETYGDAVGLGFRGHMTNWNDNILAGRVAAGAVDLTPKKLQRQFE